MDEYNKMEDFVGGGIPFALLGLSMGLQGKILGASAFFAIVVLTVIPLGSSSAENWVAENRLPYIAIVAIVGAVGLLDWIL